MGYTELDLKAINTIRLLAVDATFNSKSGHPGAPMGMAPAAHVLFSRILRFNPQNPDWLNRDRFVLSNGHGCMLQYALLHLTGYDVTMNDIIDFRKIGSKTPGHPEAHDTPGVEVTTGPLGQGICNAVGLAMAQAHTAAIYNKDGFTISNNYTYCFLGDGCLMEGVSAEASSLAGHYKLGNLICIYDDNHICIDGDTNSSFTEDVSQRYESYGWHVVTVKDGDNDLVGIETAIRECMAVADKPSMIKLRTTIGYGSLQEGSHDVHGSPLKTDDIKQLKEKWGFNPEMMFEVSQDVYALYARSASQGIESERVWDQILSEYGASYPEYHADLQRRLRGDLPDNWEKALPVYSPADAALATRKTSENVLNSIASIIPELFGGSADLTSSNLTRWKTAVDFQHPSTAIGSYAGRYLRYGVREHGMAAIMNGLAAYGTILPFGGTFLNFVSYAAGAVRLSALSKVRVLWIATHDSIGLGADGPTHQPIETLSHFRALPNTMVWRPADGNETSAAYYVALSSRYTPSILALARQNLPQLHGSSIEKARKGGYVVHETKGLSDVILISTGSEVYLCVEAAKSLKLNHSINARVVSLPCWEVFDSQSLSYRLSVIPDGIPVLSVEPLSTMGWERYAHESFGLDRFGASGPADEVYQKFEFTVDGISKRAIATLNFWKVVQPLRSPVTKAFEKII